MKNARGRTIAKQNLPSKTCPACNRPFSWRAKWAKDWDRVIYCSKGCRAGKAGQGQGQGQEQVYRQERTRR
jgi:hypothetical protein